MVVDLGDFPIQGCFLFLIVIINHGKIRKRAFPKEEVLVFFYFEVSFYLVILFENLLKQRQLHLAVYMVTDFVSFIRNLKNMF